MAWTTAKPSVRGICTSRSTRSGFCSLNEGDRLSSVSRFRDGFDLRLTAEQPLQPLARERLVVHDENPQSHRPSSGATVRIGNVMVTRTPRPAACSTTRRALSPYSRARRVLVFVSPIPE